MQDRVCRTKPSPLTIRRVDPGDPFSRAWGGIAGEGGCTHKMIRILVIPIGQTKYLLKVMWLVNSRAAV